MAVHTQLGTETLKRLLVEYGYEEVLSVEPASHGIENSNFLVQAASSAGNEALVVTLFESELAGDGFVFTLLEHLEKGGLSVPVPLCTHSGERITRLSGRPACVVKRFPGSHPRVANKRQCAEIGGFLGQMHGIAEPLTGAAEPHPRDANWLMAKAAEARPLVDSNAAHLLDSAVDMVVALLGRSDVQALPMGVVHGDLFRDNALFEGDQLVAVIDFHHAARALLAFDLAVALNDWTLDAHGRPRPGAREALIEGYQAVRSMTVAERVYLDALCLYAALCFWISRLSQVRRLANWGNAFLPEWRLDRVLATGAAKDPRWFQKVVQVLFDP